MKRAYIYDTKLGKILIADDGQSITKVALINLECNSDRNQITELFPEYQLIETELIKEAANQLMEYLEGNRREFTVKLDPQGTEFQRKVWDALKAIPYGETRSYKQIAQVVGNEKASRAVGMANHNNPIICMIPCHRVIGTNGSMVGYAVGIPVKEQLLNMEKERK